MLSRRLVAGLASALMLSGALATGYVVAGPTASASAAPPLECGTIYSIQGTGTRNVRSVDTDTGTMTSVGSFSISNATQNLNGLGISADGERVYGILPANSGSGRTVYRLTRATEQTQSVGSGVSGATPTHGAVNPLTGFYYYGGMTDDELRIYGFNTTTNTSLGLVASGDIPNGGGNGDWAFDSQGRLYVIAGDSGDNVLSVIDQTIPTTPQTTPLGITASEIATVGAQAAINGVAFGGDGFLYLSSSSRIYQVDPGSGDVVDDHPLSASGSVDLASCASPSTIEVRKDFPDGRANAGDQVTVSVTGGGIGSGNTGTTTGSDPGVQGDPAETAGPVLGLTGTTYTITETGAGAGNDYTKSWECVNQDTDAGIASGSGTSGQFTMPDGGAAGVAVLCTFTNAVVPDATDAGDAPTSYGTVTADDGPIHAIPGYDDGAHTAPLMLGASVDAEDDGIPGQAADGDDTTDADDEDAMTGTAVFGAGETTASLDVPVANSTGSEATLSGWVDADEDGAFQSDEQASVNVPAGATSASLSWTGLPALRDGAEPLVRLRLTTGTLVDDAGTAGVDERALGAAPDGEVEDHRALVAATLPPGCGSPFVEDFGAGAGYGPPLPAGQTTYAYEGSSAVNDGEYGLLPALPGSAGGWWHTGSDHTPNDTNGRMMVINASFQPGQFFQRTLTGLEPGSTYDFSAWITNANNAGSTILPNVTFRVVEPGTGDVVAQVDTGSLPNLASLVWSRYGMRFEATQPTLLLELVNNAPGGNGNDLAIDDISFNMACEFGDAPESYGTLLADDGPMHVASGPRLGAERDGEGDGLPSAAADGDDTTDTDDEDGVADPIVMTAGEPTTVEVAATNDAAESATLAGWLDLDGDGTFEVGERVIVPVDAGTATYPVVFPAGPESTTSAYARFRIFPGTVNDAAPTGPASAGEVEDYPVQVLTRGLAVAKDSDATADSRPGDTVTYTVTLTNTGDGDYTTANPARLVDDLTGVLDDADFGDDATAEIGATAVADPTYDPPRLRWEGPLPAGESVTVTYTVTLKGGGDGTVRNVAWAPEPGPPGPTPDCDDPGTTVPCAEEEYPLPKLSISKRADRTALPNVGETMTYTVTVRNDGPGVYTTAAPATFTDDLTEVLDDADLDTASINASRGTATFASPGLTWTGALAVGDEATVTYTVEYTGLGDQILLNAACVPAAEAGNPDDPCRSVTVPGSGLEQAKTSSPSSGSVVGVGEEITYTLRFSNTGQTTGAVDTFDDLSGVLDDATLVGGPTAQGDLTASHDVAGNRIVIGGSVPVGETLLVTYTVRVDAFADQDDHVLRNALACQAGEPAPCEPETTEHQVRGLEITKTSDATADTRQGDTVTYTVTAENVGAGAYTAADPAVVVDDLTGVLDDADYGDDATASVGDDPTYADPRVRWDGPLASGETVTITYTVTLEAGGDGVVENVAWAPDPGNPPGPTPDCDDPATAVPCADVDYELPRLTVTKTADRTELPAVGQVMTYSVTVTNEGPGDYTAGAPATFADDLTEVLDDAAFVDGSESATTGTPSYTEPELSWSGVLAAGDDAQITYRVRYTGGGDQSLVNAACVPADQALVAGEDCDTVTVPGSELTQAKTSDPADGSSVDVGDEITYTLTFTNDGDAAASVDTSDDLSDVLDDATFTSGPDADNGLTAQRTGDAIVVVGLVPPGQSLSVTYTVTVDARGDGVLRNALACQPGDPQPCEPETTEHQVRELEITKTSDATADTRQGDTVTYTVTAENVGTGDYTAAEPAVVVDDLTGVLDDADYGDDATASVGDDPTYAEPRLRWEGELGAGDTVTITYTVTLEAGGDGVVENVAWAPDPGDPPGPTPDCDDPATAVPCADVEYELPRLSVNKTADRSELPAVGEEMTYTVVVRSEGPGDYTAAQPATFTDVLTEVLDDATFVDGSATATTGTASFTEPRLTWSGVLDAGDTATITYRVRYTGAGDQSLANAACVPADQALTPGLDCDSVTVPGSDLSQTKTSDPADGSSVDAGDEITYTLTFTNDGDAAAAVDTSDDLSGVVDDAGLVDGPTAGDGLTATRDGDRILVTGTVPPGQSSTVTYTVRVSAFGDQGDHVLRNALACQPGEPRPCAPETTRHPVRQLEVTKTSDATSDARPGDTVSYTVTAENTGAGDYPADEPAVVVDDLTAVLDDADYNDDATADLGDDPTYADPRLRWEGALASGDTVTISYTVTLTSGGDGVVRNVAWAPDPGDPPGPTPDCDDPATTVPCADEEYELPRLSIVKAADRTELPAINETMTYTVTVRNEGPGDYTDAAPATFTDDLTAVLDDATFDAGSLTSSVGDATFDSPEVSWSGALNAGGSATITYSVTYTGDGDQQLDNAACVPDDEALDAAAACITVRVPGSGLVQTKSSSPASGTTVGVGDEVTYTLRFTNTGPAPATVDTSDDLSGVLDDATLVDGPTAQAGLSATRNGDSIEIAGTVPTNESLTVTYTVRVRDVADRDDHVLENALACQPGDPPTCEPATTEHPVRGLLVTKTSDATADARPGDTVGYTVTAQNTGAGDYTADDPATVTDDLTGVLDDAGYNGDATASLGDDPTYAEPRVTWTGALPAGQTVTITYTVTLAGGGDGDVANVAWATDPGNPPGPTPDCDDPATTVPCAEEQYDLPKLSIVKTADPAEASAVGDVVTYTVTVTNEGPGDYTAAEPATFSDDLTDVLDDATYVDGSETASTGTATFTSPDLDWTGVLAAGDDATVTYRVRYTGAGDHSLVNAACVPEDEAMDPAEHCDAVTVLGPGLTQTKSADPADGASVGAGDEVTYTLTFANTGKAAARVDTSDDLSGVLDDATLTAGPNAQGGLTATRDGNRILVTGSVPAGETRTVTYTVTVNALKDQGDHVLRNALACQRGAPVTCEPETTEHPVQALTVTKTSDAQQDVDTGDTVTYTVTVRNDGAFAYTAADPATVVDDLSDVLDDAAYLDGSASSGTLSFATPELTWSGALDVGASVTITYRVTVTNQGDHDLENTVTVPGCDDPACGPPPVVTPLPCVVPGKTSDPASGEGLGAGDVVTYTLTWTNEGQAAGVVDATDDLSDVLDDADLTGDPVSSSPDVVVTRDGDTLRIVGPIGAGETVTVTYSVTIRPDGRRGDNRVGNVLVPDTPQVDCYDDGDCDPVDPPTTENPIGELDDWKTADPASGDTVVTGDELTYTLHFANTGTADVDVDREDALGDVLDDAELVSGPTSSDPALQVSGPDGDGRIRITGTLEPGQTVTITYTVRVRGEGGRGNDRLGNFLVDPGTDPPTECAPATDERPDCTENPAGEIGAEKTVEHTGATVAPGDRLRYTLTFRNTGRGPTDVDYRDDLSEVLDDAEMVGGPTSSDPALDVERRGSRIRITGSLAPGQAVEVTYTMRVREERGDGQLDNYLLPDGDTSPSQCPPTSRACTTTAVSPQAVTPDPAPTDPNGILPDTGAEIGATLLAAALLLLLAGGGLMVTGRRRRSAG